MELAEKRAKAEEEKIRALPAKEREEVKRRLARPSGRQLFETSKVSSADDEGEDGETVDLTKYTREERDAARWGEEEKGIKLEDSDDE